MGKAGLPSRRRDSSREVRTLPKAFLQKVHAWWIRLSPVQRVVVSVAGLGALCAAGSFSLSQFDQARGIVNLAYSRFWLACFSGVAFLAVFLVTAQVLRRLRVSVLLSVLVAVAIFIVLDRLFPMPSTENPIATCTLPKDESLCQLTCTVTNSNPVAVKSTAVGFVGYFPNMTRISAPPDFRVKLEASDALPVPDPEGHVDRNALAFTVYIPQLPPKITLAIDLWTDDSNNRRACQQTTSIANTERPILERFLKAVKLNDASLPAPDLNTLVTALAKQNGIYRPEFVQSEYGRQHVTYITAEEERALALQANLDSLKPKYASIFDRTNYCTAPVFTVAQTGGTTTTFAMMLRNTYLDLAAPIVSRSMTTMKLNFRPTPPVNYACAAKL